MFGLECFIYMPPVMQQIKTYFHEVEIQPLEGVDLYEMVHS